MAHLLLVRCASRRRSGLAATVFAIGMLLGLFSRPGWAAGDGDKAAARAHYETATRLFEVREYADALKEYKAAYVAKPDPAFLFNIGQCLRKLDRNTEALDFFRQYLKKAPADDPNVPTVEARIRNIEAGLGSDYDPFTNSDGPQVESTPPAGPRPTPIPQPQPPLLTTTPAPTPVSPAVQPNPATLPVSAATLPEPAGVDLAARTSPEGAPSTPIFKTWWFWTGVGAVVAAGTITAIVLSSRGGGTNIPDSSLGARGVFP